MTAEKAGRGRPAVYRPEFADHARKLALLGATDAQVAEFFGVSERAVNAWKTRHPDFGAALTSGKLGSDARVAESLYKAAIGAHFVTEQRTTTDANGVEAKIIIESQVPPDVQAMRWWLKNRQAELWRDKVEVDSSVQVNGMDAKSLDEKFVRIMAEAQRRQEEVLAERRAMGLIDPE